MNKFSRIYVVSAILFLAGFALLSFPLSTVKSQTKLVTYTEIITALGSKIPNSIYKTKADIVKFLIKLVKESRVDKPLTADREDDLRQAGATDDLISVIRQNSPPLPNSSGTSTPTPTPTLTPTITPTPTPTTTVPPPVTTTPVSATKPTNLNFKTDSNSLGMEFVQLPAGSFMMGSPPTEKGRNFDETQHRVIISRDFYIGRHEITQGQWKEIMGTNPSWFKECGDNCPVESVSWNDVQEFIAKLNAKGMGTYRLPTEAEWEYAARVGKEGEPFGIGDGKNLSSDLANFRGEYPYGEAEKRDTINKTTPVGSYPPNAWGLYDMHGNVREWCSNWFAEYVTSNPTIKDPKGPVVGLDRVYRGGSWDTGGHGTRSAYRYRRSPSERNEKIGFRLVKVD